MSAQFKICSHGLTVCKVCGDPSQWHRTAPSSIEAMPAPPGSFKDAFIATPTGYPDNNPKTAFGLAKLPLDLAPPCLHAYASWAFADGAKKYGPYNWREKKISASVYYAALKRHLDAWWDGEERAKDSDIPHLAHAAACIGMLIDGTTNGQNAFNDDRPRAGGSAGIQDNYAEWRAKRDA